MDVMHEYNVALQYKCVCYDISRLSSRGSCKHQQHTSATALSTRSSNIPNYPRQLLGSYNALMHVLHCSSDSSSVDAATSTVSSASVAITAAVAAAVASAAADATPHLHVSPKLADLSCDWTSRSIRKKNIVA